MDHEGGYDDRPYHDTRPLRIRPEAVEQRVGHSPDERLGFIAEVIELEAPVVGQPKMDLKFREGAELTGFRVADLIKPRNCVLFVARPDG